MRVSIMAKVMLMVTGIVLISCLSVFFTSIHYMNKGFDKSALANIKTMKSVVGKDIDKLLFAYKGEATILGHDVNIEKGVVARDVKSLKKLSAILLKETGADFITITDVEGKVLARGHSDKAGDSATSHEGVGTALKGKRFTGVVSGTVIPFSLRATAPVYHGDEVIGTVSLGRSLISESFVDDLKSITGLDITVFKDDTRVMTTIVKNGRRAIGTSMSNPEVIKTVLEKGRDYLQKNEILGVKYQTAYWPIVSEGKIKGMWFIGAPLDILEQTRRR